ncbi:MAG: hypothetical protein ABJB40_11165 [Acidobacteriota bacterium]
MKPPMLLIAIVTVALFAAGCDIGDNEEFRVPEGFHGRVLILFDRADGAAKEYDWRTRIYKIPSDGFLKTQFGINDGWHAMPKVFYVGNAQYEVPFLLEPNRSDTVALYACCVTDGSFQKDASTKQFRYEQFYIGTREQINAASKQVERENLGQYSEP